MFGRLPVMASSRWDRCFGLLSQIEFQSTCVATSQQLSMALDDGSHSIHELGAAFRVVGLLRINLDRLFKSDGHDIGYVYELLSAQVRVGVHGCVRVGGDS